MSKKRNRRVLAGVLAIFSLFYSGQYFMVLAADGSGTNSVSPTSATQSSTGNTFTFTFTAAETMDRGEVVINLPTGGFSTPQGSSGTAGYTTVSTTGSNTVAKQVDSADAVGSVWVEKDADTCTTGPTAQSTTMQEGSNAITCANAGATTPDNNDALLYDYGSGQDWSNFDQVGFWFRTSANITGTGVLAFRYYSDLGVTAIESFDLFTLNGSAQITANTWYWLKPTLTAARTSVRAFGIAGLAANGGLDNRDIFVDEVLLGYTTSSAPSGALAFNDQDSNGTTDIRVRLIDLASSATVTVTYGEGGGTSGVTAPASAATYTFTTKNRVNNLVANSLTAIASPPTVEVTAASPTYTQNDFEWFVTANSVTLTDVWPSGGFNLAENSVLTTLPRANQTLQSGDKIRIQMNITVGTATLNASSQRFQLQYVADDDCTTAVGWAAVGAKASAEIWRLYDEAAIGDSTAQVNDVSTSNAGAEGYYSEINASGTGLNPNAVTVGQNTEWDWPVEDNGAAENTTYCFRMVKHDGVTTATALDSYNADSYPKLSTAPGTSNLLRHGNFFQDSAEKGFHWTD